MNRFVVRLGDESKKVVALRKGQQLWFHQDGETFCVDLSPKANSRQGENLEVTGTLLAPMPGRILKIFKKAGDPVEEGESIVIMEAMKMEYTLKASRAGVLKELNCKEGDQVELHQRLVHVE